MYEQDPPPVHGDVAALCGCKPGGAGVALRFVVRLVCDSDTSTIRLMTTREKVERLLDRLSETELEAEYERLREAVEDGSEMAPLPDGWGETVTGEPMPNVVAAVRRSRASH
jgi:hypothetical protein